ncbi:hypothetical protein Tco_1227893 [Tanacetum coccineum]
MMDDPNITIEEYIKLQAEMAQRRGRTFNWETTTYDMALPPRDQRYQYLRFEGLEYTDADIADFEERLGKIYGRGVYRVQVFDFGGLTILMAEGLSGRMVMEHKDAHGQTPGPERQPNVAAGALEVAEGAPNIDEGAQAISAHVQSPQPPPTARTLPQRVARLEEEGGSPAGIHGLFSRWYYGLAGKKVTLRVSMAWAKEVTTGTLVRYETSCEYRGDKKDVRKSG